MALSRRFGLVLAVPFVIGNLLTGCGGDDDDGAGGTGGKGGKSSGGKGGVAGKASGGKGGSAGTGTGGSNAGRGGGAGTDATGGTGGTTGGSAGTDSAGGSGGTSAGGGGTTGGTAGDGAGGTTGGSAGTGTTAGAGGTSAGAGGTSAGAGGTSAGAGGTAGSGGTSAGAGGTAGSGGTGGGAGEAGASGAGGEAGGGGSSGTSGGCAPTILKTFDTDIGTGSFGLYLTDPTVSDDGPVQGTTFGYNATEGNTNPGAEQMIATFGAFGEEAQLNMYIGNQNWGCATKLHAWVKLTSAADLSHINGVALAFNTGGFASYHSAFNSTAGWTVGTWHQIDFTFATPSYTQGTMNLADVNAVDVQLQTKSSGTTPIPTTVYVDDVWID